MGWVTVVRTARITVETDTIIVVRRASKAPACCPVCQAQVDVITLDNAGPAEAGAAAQIQRWLDSGKLHLWQESNGPTQICLPSLLRCLELDEVPKFRIAKETT